MVFVQYGIVKGYNLAKNKDGEKKVILLQVEITSPEDVQTVELMNQTGEDNNPPIGSRVTIVNIDNAFKMAIATDDLIVPITAPGEKRIYSTSDAGDVVKASILLKNDGTIVANNEEATITVNPDGQILIDTPKTVEITSEKTIINNDVEIIGNLDVTQKVTALNVQGTNDVTFGEGASEVSGKEHTHSQGNDGDNDSEVDTDPPNTI